jgi:hypothetical protein
MADSREGQLERAKQWIEDLAGPPRRLHVSTLRNYQVTIRFFMEYLLDARYPWRVICQQRLGAAPQQVIDERLLIRLRGEFEGEPGRPAAPRPENDAVVVSEASGEGADVLRDRAARVRDDVRSRRGTGGYAER